MIPFETWWAARSLTTNSSPTKQSVSISYPPGVPWSMGDPKTDTTKEPVGDLIPVPQSRLEELARGLFADERCKLDDLLDEAINEDPNLD